MSSMTISRRELGCLVLALLSLYTDARRSHYLEILTSLQRLENFFTKHVEQNTLNCLVPVEKLFSLFLEHQTASNESNETKSNGQNSLILPKALDHNDIQQLSIPKKKHRRKNRNRNENANINTNINENINEDINANRRYRRAFDDAYPYLSKWQNSNFNLNSNLNKNREDIFDFSDEDDEV